MAKLKNILSAGLKFFPIQLLFLHFKKSHLLLLSWVILFGFVSQTLAAKFGVPYLFLSPEYLEEVNWLSYLILGFAVGGFFMAFHLYSYIILGPSFPFIATLAKPFYKFCINNSVIPTIFYLILLYNIYQVQSIEELRGTGEIMIDLLSFSFGLLAFVIVSVLYFFKTNLDIFKMKSKSVKKKRSLYSRVGTLFTRKDYWFESHHARAYQPSFYVSSFRKILPARESKHYDRKILRDVFRQNQLNASLFEIFMIISFLLLGIFQDFEAFQIPAGASIMLLFTIVLMVITIFYSWFKGWAISIIVSIFILINLLSVNTGMFKPQNEAFGLNYDNNAEYNLESLKDLQLDMGEIQSDLEHHIKILDKWKNKASKIQGTDKPKLLILNSSGGGIRSAMWTYYVMQRLDHNTEGNFTDITHMITGASGGMIGASYYREIYRQSKLSNLDPTNEVYLENISKDLLNNVALSMVSHDLFLRYQRVEFEGKSYLRDRGYTFEHQLHKNTDFMMDKPLGDYTTDEFESKIPLMIFSPAIINDGRRMIIGCQPYGFLNGVDLKNKKTGPENIEYLKLFKDNDPMNVRFSSVLRMNSTFPYILPMVTMPTNPEIQVMDAGIRDNYGTKTTVRYIKAIEKWLEENTSGVVIVEIRDINKDYDLEHPEEMSFFERLITPISNFYGNFHHAQEFNSDELFESVTTDNMSIDIVTFVLRSDPKEKISLSWHLTQREKNDIKKTFLNTYNQNELNKLIDLLNL